MNHTVHRDDWHTVTAEGDSDALDYDLEHPADCPPPSDEFFYQCLTEHEFYEGDTAAFPTTPGVYQVRGWGQRSGYFEPEWEQGLEWAGETSVDPPRPVGGRHRAAPRPMSSRRSALALLGLWVAFVVVVGFVLTSL